MWLLIASGSCTRISCFFPVFFSSPVFRVLLCFLAWCVSFSGTQAVQTELFHKCELFISAISCCWCPVWARGRCRISPPLFLAECCKRQLNQGSFVLLYFRLFTFFWFVLSLFICIFLYCFICQYQSSDWLWRPPPKWPVLCRVGC